MIRWRLWKRKERISLCNNNGKGRVEKCIGKRAMSLNFRMIAQAKKQKVQRKVQRGQAWVNMC